MSNDPKNPDYKVGYKNPPLTTRFKPGQSGNRKGRPKRSKNISTIIRKEANALIAITEQGRRKMLSKMEIGIKQLMNKVASGDTKALLILINEMRHFETTIDRSITESEPYSPSLTIEEAEKLYQEALKNAKDTD